MNDLTDVKGCRTVVKHWSKASHPRSTEATEAATIEQVECVRKGLRPCVGDQEGQTTAWKLFKLGLQSVVVALTDR